MNDAKFYQVSGIRHKHKVPNCARGICAVPLRCSIELTMNDLCLPVNFRMARLNFGISRQITAIRQAKTLVYLFFQLNLFAKTLSSTKVGWKTSTVHSLVRSGKKNVE